MSNRRSLLLLTAALLLIYVFTLTEGTQTSKRVKRQQWGGGFRRRQFPPPEELEEDYEEMTSSEEDEYTYVATTSPLPSKATSRNVFNNRFQSRPRFGGQSTSTSRPSPSPAQSQRLDVVANILNRPPPQRFTSRSPPSSTKKPEVRTSSNQRVRIRGRPRSKSSITTTTTTTTTAPPEEYYYYYEDSEEDESHKTQPPLATTSTTTTTTTTTTKKPSRTYTRSSISRSRATSKPKLIKFDPESQFAPPPEEPLAPLKVEVQSSTKRFTTSTTIMPVPGAAGEEIPPHLRSRYKPRTDGRFIDFLRDPNRPRELKGFDLTDYPFYVKVPDDIAFECDDKKDGYYASVPHKCQLFHYCFASSRYDFLCANYTLYDQTTFTCRFANNVDCESSAKFYYRNDDLWKETTTTQAPTLPPRKRRPRPRDYEEDYEDDYDYEEDEPRRRRPAKRRRNRKNRRRPKEEEGDEEK